MTDIERDEFAAQAKSITDCMLSAWTELLEQQRRVEILKSNLNTEECKLHNLISAYAKLVKSSGLRYEKGLSRDVLYLLKRELGEEKGMPVNA